MPTTREGATTCAAPRPRLCLSQGRACGTWYLGSHPGGGAPRGAGTTCSAGLLRLSQGGWAGFTWNKSLELRKAWSSGQAGSQILELWVPHKLLLKPWEWMRMVKNRRQLKTILLGNINSWTRHNDKCCQRYRERKVGGGGRSWKHWVEVVSNVSKSPVGWELAVGLWH